MRDAEEQVLNAEKWASLAWLDGKKYPGDEITEDWKKVLFNQFHDLAAGSGIGIIYKDAQKDYDVVRWSTNEIKPTRWPRWPKIDTDGKGFPSWSSTRSDGSARATLTSRCRCRQAAEGSSRIQRKWI